MIAHNIILGVVFLIIVYIVYMYYFGSNTTSYLAGIHDAKTPLTISSSQMPSGASSDYAYSVWIYVNNWNYRLGEKKPILERPGMDTMEFDSNLNNIIFTLAVSPPEGTTPVTHTCTLENVPLQAWTNIIMTLNQKKILFMISMFLG
jgi:hypothetical protein